MTGRLVARWKGVGLRNYNWSGAVAAKGMVSVAALISVAWLCSRHDFGRGHPASQAHGTEVSGMNDDDGDPVASELFGQAGRWWGLDLGEAHGLSRSHNTTVLRPDLGVVVRVYRPGVSVERVAALQAARRALGEAGLPVVLLIPSQSGSTVEAVNGRAVEVEEFVEHDGRMNTPARLLRGAVLLAGVHDALADLRLGPEGDHCPDANWISSVDVAASVRAGVDRIRSWATRPPTT
jgi:hypothetical protein